MALCEYSAEAVRKELEHLLARREFVRNQRLSGRSTLMFPPALLARKPN